MPIRRTPVRPQATNTYVLNAKKRECPPTRCRHQSRSTSAARSWIYLCMCEELSPAPERRSLCHDFLGGVDINRSVKHPHVDTTTVGAGRPCGKHDKGEGASCIRGSISSTLSGHCAGRTVVIHAWRRDAVPTCVVWPPFTRTSVGSTAHWRLGQCHARSGHFNCR